MPETPTFSSAAVAAPHQLAAETGQVILAQGGNAVEAMIAMAATIAVVYPHMNGIGGDGFWLIREPGGRVRAFDAAGPAGSPSAVAASAGESRNLLRLDVTPTAAGPAVAIVADGATRRTLVSHNGIVGHNMRKVQEFTVDFAPGALCILHSDGLQTQWDLNAYPGLFARMPGVIAAVLMRDFIRRRDDAMVLVARRRTGP